MKDFIIATDSGVKLEKKTTGHGVEKLNLEVPNVFQIKEGRSKATGGFSVKTKETNRSFVLSIEARIDLTGKNFVNSNGRLSDLLDKHGVDFNDLTQLVNEISAGAAIGSTFNSKEEFLLHLSSVLKGVVGEN